MRLVKCGLAGVVALGLSSVAMAQQVAGERYQLGDAEVTVLMHEFLSEEELMTLRLVGQNRDALSIFVPEGSGYAAMAVAPNEGFVRAGMPVESASAISGLADIETARADSLEACNAARNGGAVCQIVLEVAPR